MLPWDRERKERQRLKLNMQDLALDLDSAK